MRKSFLIGVVFQMLPALLSAAILGSESVEVTVTDDSVCTEDVTLTWTVSPAEIPTSDTTLDYTVRVDGDGSLDSGTECTGTNCSGELELVSGDDESDSVTTTILNADLSEDATYSVYVIVNVEGDETDIDFDVVSVTKDCPPSAPSSLSASIGDGRLFLSWSDPNTDTASVNIFYDTVSHPASTDGSDYASSTTASGGSATVEGLTNGTTYFFRVSVTDTGGNISGISNEASGIPEEVIGLADLNDELGGCGVIPSSGSRSNLIFIGVVSLLGLIIWRKRRLGPWVLLLAFFGAMGGTAFSREHSPRHYSFELSGGPFFPEKVDNFSLVYEDKNRPQYRIGLGWEFLQLFGTLELQALTGYFQADGKGVTKTTLQSTGEEFTFRIIPAQLSLVYRADFLERFFLVPFGEIGGDYFYWREDQKDGSQDHEGLVKGYHYGAGIQIPMGWMEPKHAYNLEYDWGINQVYLIGKYEISKVDDFGKIESFDLSSETWFAGLLFTF
ncbi:MAG: fibronectin type III domain-containing protein [Deltaproteobacteria bacterium]|nr:fibronectin type III domain-containing protein [Deltaproteobacteria bacterium]